MYRVFLLVWPEPGESLAISTHRDIYQFYPERMADQIISENGRALQTRVLPSAGIGVCYIEPRDRNGKDFVGGFGDCPHDSLPISIGKHRGHIEREAPLGDGVEG